MMEDPGLKETPVRTLDLKFSKPLFLTNKICLKLILFFSRLLVQSFLGSLRYLFFHCLWNKMDLLVWILTCLVSSCNHFAFMVTINFWIWFSRPSDWAYSQLDDHVIVSQQYPTLLYYPVDVFPCKRVKLVSCTICGFCGNVLSQTSCRKLTVL